MKTKDSTFHLEPQGQQNVVGAIFVDHSNRPFLFTIATLRYARRDLDPLDFRLSQDNNFSGSTNAKFKSLFACLPTGRKRRQSLGGFNFHFQ